MINITDIISGLLGLCQHDCDKIVTLLPNLMNTICHGLWKFPISHVSCCSQSSINQWWPATANCSESLQGIMKSDRPNNSFVTVVSLHMTDLIIYWIMLRTFFYLIFHKRDYKYLFWSSVSAKILAQNLVTWNNSRQFTITSRGSCLGSFMLVVGGW